MKNRMKRIFIAVVATFIVAKGVVAQTSTSERAGRLFIGIQPAVFIEPHEGERAVYANALPIVVEWFWSEWASLQFTPIVGLRFSSNGVDITQLGTGLSLPLYFGIAGVEGSLSRAFAGPKATATWNPTDRITTLTPTSMFGYSFSLPGRLVVNIEAQLGASLFFNGSSGLEHIGSHIGMFVNGGLIF